MSIAFDSKETALRKWRRQLERTDKQGLIERRAIDTLLAESKTLVDYYFRMPRVRGPSAIRRQLLLLANGLERSSKALTKLGSEGVTHIEAAAGLSADDGAVAEFLSSGKLIVLASWARAAAHANLGNLDQPRAMRGRIADTRLRSVVWLLGGLYERRLAIRPTHTTDANGKAVSMFNQFLKAAFADYKPNNAPFSWRQLDSAALAAVRELKRRP